MLQKGSEQYKQAQKLANEIKDMAGTDRWNNNSYFDIAFNALGQFISCLLYTSPSPRDRG